jgi:LPS-assembly protein
LIFEVRTFEPKLQLEFFALKSKIKNQKSKITLALCLWACLTAPPAGAEETLPAPWQISADRLTRYRQPEIIVAEGQVVLTRQKAGSEPMVIKAAWMRYDVDVGEVRARGDVSLETDDYLIDAAEARLLLDKETGILLDSTITMPREEYNLYLTGREIEKTGALTYHIEGGTVTSCLRQPDRSPPWVIESRDVRIKKEGMAVLKHATLNIKDIPVAYTPYMVFPANTERKSGFLLPEISRSERSGAGLITPYFLNLSPSHDVTLYPGYLEKRGEMIGLEARYMADPRSFGTFLLTYQRDGTADVPATGDAPAEDYLDDGFLRTSTHDRFWLRGKADHYFSDSLVARLDFDVVSDRDFLQEFREGLLGYNATNRQFLKIFNRGLQDETIHLRASNLQAVKSWDSMLLMGEVQSVQDLRDIPLLNIPFAETPVYTLPRFQFSGRSFIPETPLSLAWNSELVNYWREQGVGYQRLDLHPQLVLPIPRGVLEGHLTGGVRETAYLVQAYGDSAWNRDAFQSRTIEDLEAEIATTFFRDFSMDAGAIKSLIHTVRPTLIYNYIPSKEQTSLPLIDGVDRIAPQNWLTYQLNNHFDVGESLAEGALAKRYLGYFRVSQAYDIREDRRRLTGAADRQRQFSDVLVELDIHPLPNLRLNYETAASVYGQGITYYKLFSSYAGAHKTTGFFDFNYRRDPSATPPFFYMSVPTESEQKLTLGLMTRLTRTISVQGNLTQVWRTEIGEDGLSRDVKDLEEAVRILYNPGCWAVEFMASKTPDDRRFAVVFSLTGIGDLLGVGLFEDSFLRYQFL